MWYEVDENASQQLIENVEKKAGKAIIQHVMGVLFGRLHYNAESSGIGWVTVSRYEEKIEKALTENNRGLNAFISHDIFMEIVTSVIRLIGNSYRYYHNPYEDDVFPKASDADFQNLKAKAPIRLYIYECCKKYGIPYSQQDGRKTKTPNTLGQAVLDYLRDTGNKQMFLMPHTLKIRCVSGQEKGYICPKCGRVHLNKSAGICTNCFSRLDEQNTITVDKLRRRNIIK